ncbi:hypothetical protein HY439_00885 [Candidatus Microgenomates bacterium]|nr:hypothetical protein [Candidatus Microgenomates bacterium]
MVEFDQQPSQKQKKSRFSWRTKIILFLLLIIAVLLGGGWFYFQSISPKLRQANQNLIEIKMLNEERQRCSQILSQQSGKFTDYDYCKQLLQKFPMR